MPSATIPGGSSALNVRKTRAKDSRLTNMGKKTFISFINDYPFELHIGKQYREMNKFSQI